MDDGYIYLLFLLLLHCMEWRLFCLTSWQGVVCVGGQFPEIFGWETRLATQSLSLRRISARGNWVEKLVFCVEFIYLFLFYLFIYCLFVCLLFNYFKGAIVWFSALGRGGTISVFWWVSSCLICSPVDLMQDGCDEKLVFF